MDNNIRGVIRERGLKCNWLAEQLNVAPSDISNWCSGERKPNQKRLVKLARLCNCSVKDLYPNISRRTIWEY